MADNATNRCILQDGAERSHRIATTAGAFETDREACLQSGMNDYLSKPLRLGALQQALERCPQIAHPDNPKSA
ncbi:MAG: hypothetical protein K9N62_17300 [Verrucomicrobia bacterium]|nr:hypothetical protein [Verrucomicrobiota bacterium]